MLQRIKAYVAALRERHFGGMSISLRLTLLHAAILLLVLCLSGIFVMGGAGYILYKGMQSDVRGGREAVARYAEQGGDLGRLGGQEALFARDVGVAMQDGAGRWLFIAGDRPEKRKGDNTLETVVGSFGKMRGQWLRDRKNDYYGEPFDLWQDGKAYKLLCYRRMSEEAQFLEILFDLLLATSLVGIAVAVAAGVFFGRRMLRPLREIMRTMQRVKVKELGIRLATGERRDEISALAAILNGMLDRIEDGFQRQRRFVSDASHELRTPITVIGGYADMLARWGKNDPAALEEGVAAICAETEGMRRLVERLLFLARADQDRQVLQKKKISLRALLDEIARETRLIAPEYTICFTPETDMAIVADADAIKQMVRCFMENSLKFTPRGGRVTLGCAATETGALLFVEDTGVGIPTEAQARIFERFYRVDASRTKQTGGSGLGLAIAKWIAEAHGAQIELTSAPGQGTRIVVRLPVGTCAS